MSDLDEEIDASISPSEKARRAAEARWAKRAEERPEESTLTDEEIAQIEADEVSEGSLPVAVHRGALNIIGMIVPCYVLDNGVRVIGRTSATEVLTGIKGGGALEKYIAVRALEPFIPKDLVLERMVPFRLPEVDLRSSPRFHRSMRRDRRENASHSSPF